MRLGRQLLTILLLASAAYGQMAAITGKSIPVTIGLLPTPPGTSAYLTNLQLDSVGTSNGTWTKCNANGTNDNGVPCAAGTPNGLGDATLTTNYASSPSRSGAPTACQAAGNTMKITSKTSTGSVNVSGTTVTLASGDSFLSQWGTNTSPIKINGTTVNIVSVTDSSHLTIDTNLGTLTGVTYISTTGNNTLFYHHSGNSILGQDSVTTWTPATVQNVLVHLCYYFDPGSTTNWVGPEWDPDFFVSSTWTYKISWACYHTSDKWNVYDQSIQNWRQTNTSCDINTTGAGAWHEFWLYFTVDQTNHQYTYHTFTEDGNTIWSDSSPPTCPSLSNAPCATFGGWNHNSGNQINFETQLDSSSTAGTITGHVFKYEAWLW